MSLAKLSSGDGYEYYLRNIATHDANERGEQILADYYSERGESPGRWLGSGLAALDIEPGEEVTEPQMRALFGRGMHPNAEKIIAETTAEQMAQGVSRRVARNMGVRLAQLGRPFSKFAADEYSYRYECGRAFAAYNAALGLDENAAIPDEERDRIRTEVALRMFEEEYGREPLNDRELSGWIARASRPTSTAVAGFDLTFSPVKSISALWALAPREIAEKIEAAHHAAVADVMEFIEAHAVYTRVGRNGVRLVDVDGVIATAYDHRDSRAGDPDLHTHVVIANRVRRTHDGQWGTLHAQLLYKLKVAASEIYNTRLEHHSEQMVGLVFAERGGLDPNKRPIREVVGVSEHLLAAWSTRAEAITAALTELAIDFQNRHGHEPSPVDLLKLGQKATLATRGGKYPARTRAEQRAAWRAGAAELLGGTDAVDAMVDTALHQQIPHREPVTAEWITVTATRTVTVIAEGRATWQYNHIRAETERQLRGRIDPGQWRTTVEQVVTTALSPPFSIPRGGEYDTAAPSPALARLDGTSVYTTPGAERFTSPEIVAAEERLITAAQTLGAHTIPADAVAAAIVEFAANNHGHALNPGQQALVSEFAGSGAVLQIGLAPAGTGKTTAMRVLANAWRAQGHFIVDSEDAANQAASRVRDTGAPTATVDMLSALADRLAVGEFPLPDTPDWFASIGAGTLVILDEAAKTGTLKLDAAVEFLREQGAVVRAIGDDRQLSAVAAGGVVRDIIHTAGAQTLDQVMRFADPAESAASLALREGDPAAIAHYTDHGRVQVGTLGTVTDAAYTAWQADVAAGLDSLLLAPTRDLVAALNQRARRERLATARTPVGPETELADGLSASAGDVICTRRNAYGLHLSTTDHVRNGYRFTVRGVHPSGAVTATHHGSGRSITLPADYVHAHTTLGYASTIDAAQGLTVDTCHGVLTGRESRAQLYVLMTRGRTGNYAYIGTAGTGEESAAYTYEAIHPPTAVDLLTDILGREGTQTSATTAERESRDPRVALQGSIDAYLDALGVAAEHRYGPEQLAELATAAEQLVPGLTGEQAWPILRQHLATLALSGRDPAAVLADAVSARELGTALDRAAVLDWRIDPTGGHSRGAVTGLLPWVPLIPDPLRDDPEYGPLLSDLSHQIYSVHLPALRDTTREWSAETAPRWAQPLLDDPGLVTHLAVWRAAQGVPDNDRRPTGPVRYPVAERAEQRHLDHLAAQQLGDLHGAPARWAAHLRELDPHILEDPYWPILADHLDRAHTAGTDIISAARTAATVRPLPDEQPAAALRWRLTEHLAHADHAAQEQFAAAVQQLQDDQQRRLRDDYLTARAAAIQTDLDDEQALLQGDMLVQAYHQNQASDTEKVQARHDDLDEIVAAIDEVEPARIAAARAEQAARDARTRWEQERDTRAPVPRYWPYGREADRIREAHDKHIQNLRKEWDDLHEEAQQAASEARDAERTANLRAGVDRSHWDYLRAQAADTDTREAELAAAAERDRTVAEQQAAQEADYQQRHQQYQDELRAQLDEIRAEQQRRDDLDSEHRTAEDHAREHLDGPEAAEHRHQQQARHAQRQAEQRAERDREHDYWSVQNTINHNLDYGIDM